MTFKTLQDDVMARLNLTSTDARTRVKAYINEHYHRITAKLGLATGRDAVTTIAVVAATEEYSVTAQKIKGIYDTTNDLVLSEVSLTWIREQDPGVDATGVPEFYAVRKQSNTALTVRLYPSPSANNTLDCDITAIITELSADGDAPTLLPDDYHWLLGLGARLSEYEKQDDGRYKVLLPEYLDGIRDLRYFLRKSHSRTFFQNDTRVKRSRLGPWYPE